MDRGQGTLKHRPVSIYFSAVTSLVYQYTVYQRRLNPTYDNGTTPMFSTTVPTFQACINKCHIQPPCDSLVFDTVTLKCSLYEGNTVEEEITINQIYHQVLNKTVHRDIIGKYRLFKKIRYLHDIIKYV